MLISLWMIWSNWSNTLSREIFNYASWNNGFLSLCHSNDDYTAYSVTHCLASIETHVHFDRLFSLKRNGFCNDCWYSWYLQVRHFKAFLRGFKLDCTDNVYLWLHRGKMFAQTFESVKLLIWNCSLFRFDINILEQYSRISFHTLYFRI